MAKITAARKKREGTVGGKRRKDGTMIGTAKIFWLRLNELNDEKVLKRNILTCDLIWWIFGMSQAGRCILFRVSLEFGEACRILWRDDGEQFVQVMVRDGDIL